MRALTALYLPLLCLAACRYEVIDPDTALRAAIEEAGITPMEEPRPFSRDMVRLGTALFFDRILSGNKDIACDTCHHVLLGGGDALPISIGTGGDGLGDGSTNLGDLRVLGEGRVFISRNAPEIFNRGRPEWHTMFWDTRVSGAPGLGFETPAGDLLPEGIESALEAQALFPLLDHNEMRGQEGDLDFLGEPNELALLPDDDPVAIWDAIMARVLSFPEYIEMFQKAFPGTPVEELSIVHVAKAIAAYEIEVFTLFDSPWDRYVKGDDLALSPEAKRGALLFFGKAGCARCHAGNLFTDQEGHNIAVPQFGPGGGDEAPLDFGIGRLTENPEDRFTFRTPPLRNLALTAPYMHNGAYESLTDAVRHHLSPEESLRGYDPGQLGEALAATYHGEEEVISQILETLDPLLASPGALSEEDLSDLIAFLEALTDEDARSLRSTIPLNVPSGLPLSY